MDNAEARQSRLTPLGFARPMRPDGRLLVPMPNLRPEKQGEAKNGNTLVALPTLIGLLFRCSRNALGGCEGAAIMAEPVCQKGVVRGLVRSQ